MVEKYLNLIDAEVYVFDLDNTLYQEVTYVAQTISAYLTDLGASPDELIKVKEKLATNFLNSIDTPSFQIVQSLVPNLKIELESFVAFVSEQNFHYSLTFEVDVLEKLHSLNSKGEVLWVWTNGSPKQQLNKLLKLSEQFSFEDRIMLCNLVEPKPSPASLRLIAEKEDVALDQILVVGDHIIDYISARNAGCRFLYANDFFGFNT